MADLGDLLVKKVLEDLAEAVGQNEKLLKALGVETVPDALDEIVRLKETIHELAMIEPHTARGITDSSTPSWVRVQNMAEELSRQDAEIARLRGECRRLMGLE